jgi:hypothetical protein
MRLFGQTTANSQTQITPEKFDVAKRTVEPIICGRRATTETNIDIDGPDIGWPDKNSG